MEQVEQVSAGLLVAVWLLALSAGFGAQTRAIRDHRRRIRQLEDRLGIHDKMLDNHDERLGAHFKVLQALSDWANRPLNAIRREIEQMLRRLALRRR